MSELQTINKHLPEGYKLEQQDVHSWYVLVGTDKKLEWYYLACPVGNLDVWVARDGQYGYVITGSLLLTFRFSGCLQDWVTLQVSLDQGNISADDLGTQTVSELQMVK